MRRSGDNGSTLGLTTLWTVIWIKESQKKEKKGRKKKQKRTSAALLLELVSLVELDPFA